MDTFFSSRIFDLLSHTVGWTLLHSIWQGIIFALLGGLTIATTAKKRPALRYNIFLALLASMVLVNAATCWLLFNDSENVYPISPASETLRQAISLDAVPEFANRHFTTGNYIQAITNAVDQYMPVIVMIWFTVFLFLLHRIVFGIFLIEKITKHNATRVMGKWDTAVHTLKQRLLVQSRIYLAESARVSAPLVRGIWQHMIVVPAGMLASLPADQVEAILLHEIAHIRRHDYLINLLQCFFESIYFFNPGLLWLSRLIRTERELCCDELVIGATGNRRALVNALVSFREWQTGGTQLLAISFAASKNDLLNRIKRALFLENKPLTAMEKISITAAMLAAISFSVFVKTTPENKPLLSQPKRTVTSATPAVKVENVTEVKMKRTSKPEKPAIARGVATDSVLTPDAWVARLRKALEQNDLRASDSLSHAANRAIWAEKRWIRAKDTENKLRAEATSKNENPTALPDIRQAFIAGQRETLKQRTDALRAAEAAYEEASAELQKQRRQARLSENEATRESITRDLMEAGVITSSDGLSYRLHNMFLIVNGVHQPEELHKKLKDKYLKYSWTEWVLNWDGDSGVRFTGVRFGS